MRYSYEYKLKCIEMYRKGEYPETPEGVSQKKFRAEIRCWTKTEEAYTPEALKHPTHNMYNIVFCLRNVKYFNYKFTLSCLSLEFSFML